MSIRRLVGTPALHDDHDTTEATSGDSRRQFFRKVGIGGAAAAGAVAIPGAVLAPSAFAQTSSDEVELSAEDEAVVTTLGILEAAAVAIYKRALEIPTLLAAETTLLSSYQRHHEAHVAALATARAAEDDEVTQGDTTIIVSVTGEIEAIPAGDNKATAMALYQVLYNLETKLAATFLVAVGIITEPTVTGVVAGIGPVNGQQAFQLGTDLGLPIDDILPIFQTTDGAFALPTA